MLTSVLHADRAIEAGIIIVKVFVEVAHYIRQNTPLIPYEFITSSDKIHDRYIAVDFGRKNEKLYHYGASSKDAGRRITTIMEASA